VDDVRFVTVVDERIAPRGGSLPLVSVASRDEPLVTGLLPLVGCGLDLDTHTVTHNMSNDQLKRAQHRIWPQPTMAPL
jgi:hypothetical protein